MSSTPASLLDRLKNAPADSPDWITLQGIYQPLIRFWLLRIMATQDDVDDLSQEVFVVLVRELAQFESRGKGSFRAWLREITVNQTRAHFKKRRRKPLASQDEDVLAQLEDPKSNLAAEWDREHDRHVSEKLLLLVKHDFEPATWDAFTRFALNGQPAAEVAREIGISENAVLLAKARVLKRLRQEARVFLS